MSDSNNFDERFFRVAGDELNKLRAKQELFSSWINGTELNIEPQVSYFIEDFINQSFSSQFLNTKSIFSPDSPATKT